MAGEQRESPGPVRPTSATIARRAGVSKALVSYALNGRPGPSPATRARILAIADEVGWHPHQAARALSALRFYGRPPPVAFGLVLARSAGTLAYEPFFARLISGIEAELSARQVALMLQVVEDACAEAAALRRWWAERRVDGVLLVDLRVDDPRVPVVEQLGMPAVIVGGPGPTGALAYVAGNDAGGMDEIVKHLVALGHRQIDRVAGLTEFVSTQARAQAFEEALASSGARGRVLSTDFSSSAGASATRELLEGSPRPSAIVYDNDIMAVAGLGVAQEMGIAVPLELSVVSYEDSPMCQVVRPSLTACTRDIVAYGARSARTLIALVEGKPVASHLEERPRLVPRASTSGPLGERAGRARATSVLPASNGAHKGPTGQDMANASS